MVKRLSLRLYNLHRESQIYVIKFHKFKMEAYTNKIMIDIIKVTWLYNLF